MNAVLSRRLPVQPRAPGDGHAALRLWLRLLACTNLIESAIRSRMRATFGSTLPRFDLMAQLARNPGGLRMGELSRRLMVTGGNVTGITDLLVRDGWATRQPLRVDRRAFLVKLTPGGRKAFARMAQDHEQWVVELFSHLSERERRQLHALLGSVKSGLEQKRKPQ